jgi:copper chaperone CopZ
MKKYRIDIQGMHCGGCTRLVATSLRDEDLKEVRVDLDTHSATFESEDAPAAVQAKIDRVASELSDYQFAPLREA